VALRGKVLEDLGDLPRVDGSRDHQLRRLGGFETRGPLFRSDECLGKPLQTAPIAVVPRDKRVLVEDITKLVCSRNLS
jgi:hypothetical protein